MITAPIPHNESERLARLFEYHVLDTDPEPNFDELTELLAQVLEVPIALVSLVDQDRQWFKSRHGLAATETPRDYAFCAHAILDDKPFIVEDSHVDDRFRDNPLVTERPHVRFYAGMPLTTDDGFRLGTVCGIDHKPRELDEGQKRILQIVARQVIDQLELRRQNIVRDQLFRRQNYMLQQLESSNQEVRDFVSVVAHDLRGPVINVAGFAEELQVSTRELDQIIRQERHLLSEACQRRIREVIDNDISDAARQIRRSGEQIDARISAISKMARHGRRSLRATPVRLDAVIREICANHEISLRRARGEIEFGHLPEIAVDPMSIELIVENLISNAVKYTCPARPLRISIWSDPDPDGIVLHVRDNGRGIKGDDVSRVFGMFCRVGDPDTSGDGTGLAFCRAIVRRLGGRIWCDSQFGEGSTFHVFLPAAVASNQAVSK